MAWYDKWAIMVIAVAVGLAGYKGVPWEKMGVAEWAYWVAAVGTTGTLIGTIWLATSERRYRQRQEFALAQVTAASFAEQIRVAHHMLTYAIGVLNHFATNPKGKLGDLHRVNEMTKMWNPADTIPLVALPKGVAMDLSSISARFGTTQHNLLVAAGDAHFTQEARQAFIQTQIREYERLREKLDRTLVVCLYACNESHAGS